MPKRIINRDDWDDVSQVLYRTGNERIIAVIPIGDGTRLELFTVPNDNVLEERS